MKPVYDDGQVTLYEGDCRDVLPLLEPVDLVVADPPYGETTLAWDVPVEDWIDFVGNRARQLWCFASMRMVYDGAFAGFREQGWRLAQDAVWEKHNGSSLAADRLRRVHEHALHFYRGEWSGLYNKPPVTHDRPRATVRRKAEPPRHQGARGPSYYASQAGGPRLQRSVIYTRSEHGRAIHRTQKPVGVTRLLIEHSCPPGGVVLDPFAGSCTTLVAAKQAGRRAIGVELNVDARAIDRIAQEVLPVGPGEQLEAL